MEKALNGELASATGPTTGKENGRRRRADLKSGRGAATFKEARTERLSEGTERRGAS